MTERKIALLIGVSEYGEGIPSLSAPPNDVKALQRVLQNSKLGAFDEIISLVNPELVSMKQSIQRLFKSATKKDFILFFFSGHGITDDDNHLYLATCLTAKDDFEATSVEASFIQKLSKNCYAKRQVIILDCCYSGAFANGWQSKSVGLNIKKELGAEGRVVLTSSTETQVSHQYEMAHLSLYTQYLIEGIETGAADEDRDGKIYAHDLHKYAKAKVQAVKPKMKPDIILDDEGYGILLAYAPREPEVEFRQLVEKYINFEEAEIVDAVAQDILDIKKRELGISNERANSIIENALETCRIYLTNRRLYKEKYAEKSRSKFPIDEQVLHRLREWGIALGLENNDICKIEKEINELERERLVASEASFQKGLTQQATKRVQVWGAVKAMDMTIASDRLTSNVKSFWKNLRGGTNWRSIRDDNNTNPTPIVVEEKIDFDDLFDDIKESFRKRRDEDEG
ncbi:MAG: caspase family protein [Elainellaceae cyanobacterium]